MNLYRLSVILFPLLQSNAAEYQFVSASPRLARQERVQLQTVLVIASSEPARSGFDKSTGRRGSAAEGAGDGARAVLEAGLSSGDGVVAAASIALSPVAAVVGAVSGGSRKMAPQNRDPIASAPL